MASVVAEEEDLRAHDVTQWMRDEEEKYKGGVLKG